MPVVWLCLWWLCYAFGGYACGGYACGGYACGCSHHLSSLSSPAMWALQIFSLFVVALGC